MSPSPAERYAAAALAHDPESMPALMLLAERALESGDGTTALELAERAIAVGSQSVTAWLARGDAMLLLGRDADARESFERAVALIEVDPDHGAPPARLALVQAALARHELPPPRQGSGPDDRSRAAEEAAVPEAEPVELGPERSTNVTPSDRPKDSRPPDRSKKASSAARPKAADAPPPF